MEVPPLHPAHVRSLDAYAGADLLSSQLAQLCRVDGMPEDLDPVLLPHHDQSVVRNRNERTRLTGAPVRSAK